MEQAAEVMQINMRPALTPFWGHATLFRKTTHMNRGSHMKKRSMPACVAGVILLAATLAVGCKAKPSAAGGYSAAVTTRAEVVVAAAFAIKAEEKALREKMDTHAATLELIKIVSAQEQVVAGKNYRLKLAVKFNGAEKEAEAVVWWQAWRSPEPYQLTSWEWK